MQARFSMPAVHKSSASGCLSSYMLCGGAQYLTVLSMKLVSHLSPKWHPEFRSCSYTYGKFVNLCILPKQPNIEFVLFNLLHSVYWHCCSVLQGICFPVKCYCVILAWQVNCQTHCCQYLMPTPQTQAAESDNLLPYSYETNTQADASSQAQPRMI